MSSRRDALTIDGEARARARATRSISGPIAPHSWANPSARPARRAVVRGAGHVAHARPHRVGSNALHPGAQRGTWADQLAARARSPRGSSRCTARAMRSCSPRQRSTGGHAAAPAGDGRAAGAALPLHTLAAMTQGEIGYLLRRGSTSIPACRPPPAHAPSSSPNDAAFATRRSRSARSTPRPRRCGSHASAGGGSRRTPGAVAPHRREPPARRGPRARARRAARRAWRGGDRRRRRRPPRRGAEATARRRGGDRQGPLLGELGLPLGADLLVLPPGCPAGRLRLRHPLGARLARLTVSDADAPARGRRVPAGSMGPKIESAIASSRASAARRGDRRPSICAAVLGRTAPGSCPTRRPVRGPSAVSA